MTQPIKPVSGITPDTFNRFVYDTGLLYANYQEAGERILGATRGGHQFVVEDEFREMLTDGSPGPLIGSQRRTRSVAKLTTNLIELTTANILTYLPGATAETIGNVEKITRNCQISESDYITNLTLVLSKTGTEELFAVKILNALCTSGLDFTAAENDETVIAAEFIAHYDPSTMDQEPWEIFNPLEVPVVVHHVQYAAAANGSIIGDVDQYVSAGEDASSVHANPDALYEFVNWSDASTDQTRTDLAVSGDINVTANFALI